MSEENEHIPGITIPLAMIVPRKWSSRKRAPPTFSVPSHFRPSPRLTGRGGGRPKKESSATQSPASQPSRCGPGLLRKQQSDVSPPPASPSGSSGDSPSQISVTSTPEAVAPTSLASTSDGLLEVLSGEEETKSNVKMSRILMHPPKTNHSPQSLDEESKKVILKVKSLLVKKLLTSGNGVDDMVHQANITFRYLKGLGVDYASFYKDVAEHIKDLCYLQDTEKEETMLSLSALQKKYENCILSVKDVGEDLARIQEEYEIAKDKKKTLKRQRI